MVYHKAQIVLHSKHLAGGHSFSRDVCLQASITLLEFQHLIDEERQPGGRLSSVQWILSSVFIHEFLLATSVLCFHLQHMDAEATAADAVRIRDVLEKTEKIWAKASTVSVEASRAVSVLRTTLEANSSDSSINSTNSNNTDTMMSPNITLQGKTWSSP